jgi:L-seryl-tRNA(Ser) seleniumtransferase
MNGFSLMGSGSLPGRDIPTKLIALLPNVMTVEELAYKLRKNIPPIFTRIENEAVILDFRTVFEGEEKILVEAIRDIF